MSEVSNKSPDYLAWMTNYTKLWFHQPIYDGKLGVSGEGEVVRFMGPVSQLFSLNLKKKNF